jgi:hypothetical protein
MKFRVPEIFLGVFLTIAIFSIGFTFGLPVRPKPSGSEPIQSLWIPTDSVGLYTMVLAGFTFLLVVVSGAQGYFILRADKTARAAADAAKQSADAAKRSADVAVAVELPIILFTTIKLVKIESDEPVSSGVPPSTTFLNMSYKNSGRTAATLIDQCVEHVVIDRLPDVPIYEHIFPFAPGTLIEPGRATPASIQNYFIKLTEDNIANMEDGSKSLWVYGYIAFRDFLGDRHEAKFCARWVPFVRGVGPGPTGFVYSRDTPLEYNRNS